MRKWFAVALLAGFISGSIADEENYFSYSKDPCYGTCPQYDLVLFEEGQLLFLGKFQVKNNGAYRENVGKEVFEELLILLEKARFFDFEDSYFFQASGAVCETISTDASGIKMELRYRGKRKSVYHYLGCEGFPREEALLNLEREIESLLKEDYWLNR